MELDRLGQSLAAGPAAAWRRRASPHWSISFGSTFAREAIRPNLGNGRFEKRSLYLQIVPVTLFQLKGKDFKEAVTYRKPVVEYKPRSAAAKATAALADEFLARLDARLGAATDTLRRAS